MLSVQSRSSSRDISVPQQFVSVPSAVRFRTISKFQVGENLRTLSQFRQLRKSLLQEMPDLVLPRLPTRLTDRMPVKMAWMAENKVGPALEASTSDLTLANDLQRFLLQLQQGPTGASESMRRFVHDDVFVPFQGAALPSLPATDRAKIAILLRLRLSIGTIKRSPKCETLDEAFDQDLHRLSVFASKIVANANTLLSDHQRLHERVSQLVNARYTAAESAERAAAINTKEEQEEQVALERASAVFASASRTAGRQLADDFRASATQLSSLRMWMCMAQGFEDAVKRAMQARDRAHFIATLTGFDQPSNSALSAHLCHNTKLAHDIKTSLVSGLPILFRTRETLLISVFVPIEIEHDDL